MFALDKQGERVLSDVYKATKLKSSSKSKRHFQKCIERSTDDRLAVDCASPSKMTKGPKRKELSTTFNQRYSETCTTPVPKEKKRNSPSGTLRNRNLRPTVGISPKTGQILDDDFLQSPLSSASSTSSKFSRFHSPLGSGSPFSPSPVRNCQSSQESQDITWNCVSPMHYHQQNPAHDSSNIKELCKNWDKHIACARSQPTGLMQRKSQKSLLDVWERHKSCSISQGGKKDVKQKPVARNKSDLLSQEMKELMGRIENHDSSVDTKQFTDVLRSPVQRKKSSPNNSLEELWDEEDESLLRIASQISPSMFEDTQSVYDHEPVTPIRTKTARNSSLQHSTPVSHTVIKPKGNRVKELFQDDLDDLWGNNSQVFTQEEQEVLTLLEQNITQPASTLRCTPEEIAKKKQEALSKRAKNVNTRSSRLRTTQD